MTDAATAIVKSAIHAWNVQVERAEKRFGGLSPDRLLTPVAPGRNRLVYLWGHLIAVNDGMLPLLDLGQRSHPEMEPMFVREPDRAVDGLPSPTELKQCWDDVNSRLAIAFNTFSASDWARKHTQVSAEDFAANPLRNRLSILLSRTAHMAYHLGQSALAN